MNKIYKIHNGWRYLHFPLSANAAVCDISLKDWYRDVFKLLICRVCTNETQFVISAIFCFQWKNWQLKVFACRLKFIINMFHQYQLVNISSHDLKVVILILKVRSYRTRRESLKMKNWKLYSMRIFVKRSTSWQTP